MPLSILPIDPRYWRATWGVLVPALRSPLSSMTSTPASCGVVAESAQSNSHRCATDERLLVTSRRGRSPHQDDGAEVRRVFHALRSKAIENFNGRFNAIVDGGGQVPTRGLAATRRDVLGAVFVDQLTLVERHAHHQPLRTGLKPFLTAA
jgi:hypothetical protein